MLPVASINKKIEKTKKTALTKTLLILRESKIGQSQTADEQTLCAMKTLKQIGKYMKNKCHRKSPSKTGMYFIALAQSNLKVFHHLPFLM